MYLGSIQKGKRKKKSKAFALVAARLVQKLSPVVVYVDPEVRSSIAVSEISCFLERFAVLPQWSARPCECVNWIQSYYPILTLRCLYLHHPPQAEALFDYPNVETKASIKVLVKLCRYAFWKKIVFLLFDSRRSF